MQAFRIRVSIALGENVEMLTMRFKYHLNDENNTKFTLFHVFNIINNGFMSFKF